MRSLCLLVFGCLVGLTVYTYDLKIKTRALVTQAHELTTKLQDESDLLALAKADVSYLSRPERIEQLARTALHMEPLTQAQLVPWSAVAAPAEDNTWTAAVTATNQRGGIAALIERTSAHPSRQHQRQQ